MWWYRLCQEMPAKYVRDDALLGVGLQTEELASDALTVHQFCLPSPAVVIAPSNPPFTHYPVSTP